MASKDWSAGVYWEPKSPEWPTNNQASCTSRAPLSPDRDRADQGHLSPYSDGNQSGFSPEYASTSGCKRARWDWSPESGVSSGDGSPFWNNYQWSPSSSGSPKSPLSVNESRYSSNNNVI